MKKKIMAGVFALLLSAAGAAFAQNGSSEVSASVAGVFNKDANDGVNFSKSTKSAALGLSYTYFIKGVSGVQFNYGYTQNSLNIANSGGSYGHIANKANEYTFGYVAKFNRKGEFSPFVAAGGGLVNFRPTSDSAANYNVSNQTRGAYYYAAGLDFNINSHWSMRAQYRGLVYKNPDFGNSLAKVDAYTHSAQPSIGVVFHF